MTVKGIYEKGFRVRHEKGSEAKRVYLETTSLRRFKELQWMLEARRMGLRTAHRRWLRRHGRSFKPEVRAIQEMAR